MAKPKSQKKIKIKQTMKKINTLFLLLLIFLNHQVHAQDLTSINVGVTLPMYEFNSATKVITTQMSVRNRGFFDSSSFDVALFLINTSTNAEYEIDRVNYDGLTYTQANNANTLQITGWTVDLDNRPLVPSGTYRLQARINDNQNAFETNYGNNRELFGNVSFVYTSTLGVEENTRNVDFFIVQNPVQNVLKIESAYVISEIVIYDMLSKKVNASKLSNSSFDVSNLSRGLYIVKVRVESNRVFSMKFVKE